MTVESGGRSVTTGFGWDAAGNQTARTAEGARDTLTWDAEGELASVDSGGETFTNIYDADGSRMARVEEAGVTVYLPGGQELHADADGVSATRWYSFAGTTVAVRTGTGFAGV